MSANRSLRGAWNTIYVWLVSCFFTEFNLENACQLRLPLGCIDTDKSLATTLFLGCKWSICRFVDLVEATENSRTICRVLTLGDCRWQEHTLFWFDNWSTMERLIDIVGESGTRILGISRYAMVPNAASSAQWNLRRCCRYQLRAMITSISFVPPQAEGAGRDHILWRQDNKDYKTWFSS